MLQSHEATDSFRAETDEAARPVQGVKAYWADGERRLVAYCARAEPRVAGYGVSARPAEPHRAQEQLAVRRSERGYNPV
jgi:hypothetical protein